MLGPQLTLLVLVSFVVWRVKMLLPVADMLVAGLTYFIPLPEDELLRTFAPNRSVARNRLLGADPDVVLKIDKKEAAKIPPVPKKIVMSTLVTSGTLDDLPFYTQYETSLSHAVSAVLAFLGTYLYFEHLWDPSKPETDLAPIWILISVFNLAVAHLSVLVSYGFGSSEFKVSAGFGLASFAVVMAVLSLDGHWVFQFGIEKAYQTLEGIVQEIFLESVVVSKNFAFRMSYFHFRLTLAIVVAFFSATLMFPIVRFTRCYQDAVKLTSTPNPFKRLLMHLSLIMPLFLALSYIPNLLDGVISAESASELILLNATEMEHTRLLGLLLIVGVKFLSLRTQMQAYLNTPARSIQALAKEKGQISLQEYQKKIVPSFHYSCVAMIQLLAFPLILLMFTMALLSLGGFSFLPSTAATKMGGFSTNPEFFKPVLTFICWWLCVFHFVVSIFTIVLYGAISVPTPAKPIFSTNDEDKRK